MLRARPFMPPSPFSASALACALAALAVLAFVPAARAIAPGADFQMIHAGGGLTLHKEMFMLPYTYSDVYNSRRTDAVFQISAKLRLFDTRFYFAYTQISFWQAYDYRNSAPTRDTNYNPEVFYRFAPLDYQGGRLGADAGFEHESNGQVVPLSRIWTAT